VSHARYYNANMIITSLHLSNATFDLDGRILCLEAGCRKFIELGPRQGPSAYLKDDGRSVGQWQLSALRDAD
jgi:hypothetical protein